MKIAGVIAEYNPLTKGHEYHLSEVRKQTGADTVAVVMSGNFVQRGEPAVAEKYLRAEWAVHAGADVVIELPTVYAVSPADVFALGAVKTLALLKPDVISFGSECGHLGMLKEAACILDEEPSDFKSILAEELTETLSFPKARSNALNRYSREGALHSLDGLLESPNNVLAVSYIRAARSIGLDVDFHTLKRLGASYNDDDATKEYPSASAMRQALSLGKLTEVASGVNEEVFNALKTLKSDLFKTFSDVTVYRIRSLSAEQLEEYFGYTEGLNNRIKQMSDKALTREELLTLAKSKRYTWLRLSRLILFPLLEITDKLISIAKTETPPFRVLAVNRKRTDLLARIADIPTLVTKFRDFERLPDAAKQINDTDMLAARIYSLLARQTEINTSMLLV